MQGPFGVSRPCYKVPTLPRGGRRMLRKARAAVLNLFNAAVDCADAPWRLLASKPSGLGRSAHTPSNRTTKPPVRRHHARRPRGPRFPFLAESGNGVPSPFPAATGKSGIGGNGN
jgi:hypothetical protein